MFGMRKNTSPPSSSIWSHTNDETSPPRISRLLQPAIDGPPSPEGIRAYTEQMKRSSFFNKDRSTVSSSASSFYSGSSENTSGEISLSRTSSRRSVASTMPSKGERPESIQIFGKAIFSRRTSRKSKRDTASPRTLSSLSGNSAPIAESARDNYYGRARSGSILTNSSSATEESKKQISQPFNFQHVVHTGRDHLPTLSRSDRDELASEFSSIRASQTPAFGHLKGIRAEDLNFENFSSEQLDGTPEMGREEFERPRTSSSRRMTFMKKSIPPPIRPNLLHAKSHDGLRSAPPPRPPRSPLNLSSQLPSRSPLNLNSPLPPPPRTSSRTESMIWDNFDPLASTTLERPETGLGFRKPKAFHLPISPPRPITRSFEPEEFNFQAASTVRTPPGEAWPLASPFEGLQLADVPEEEEVCANRSRMSTSSIRHSKSVPAFMMRPESHDSSRTRPTTPTSTSNTEIGSTVSPGKPTIRVDLSHEAWEDDIDYCYEHEAEADCEYEWDRVSTNETSRSPPRNNRVSLLIPATLDLPELSPMSGATLSPATADPRTPSTLLLRPQHLRSPSQASSFKESHGFNLSPSLLIPSDFKGEMEQEHMYEDIFHHHAHSHDGINFSHHHGVRDLGIDEAYPVSPIEGPSSTSSYRSSATRLSKSASLESVVLLSRAANVALQHRSVSSSGSLPELVHSSRNTAEIMALDSGMQPVVEQLVENMPIDSTAAKETADHAPEGLIMKSGTKTLAIARKPVDTSAPLASPSGTHGRKASLPAARSRSGSISAAAALGGRRRANSYALFPQV